MNSNDQKILDEIEQAAKKFSNHLVIHLKRTNLNGHDNYKLDIITNYNLYVFDFS